jgi:cytochrome c oxidase subunit 2
MGWVKGANKVGAALGLLLYSLAAGAEYAINLPPPATNIAHQIYNLHNIILGICVVIFFGVFGAMFYAIFKHRKSVGHKAAHFHENTTVEIIWTIVPFMILVGMAYPATKTLIDMKNTASADLSIKVTGYQWKWEYDYLDQGVRFFSNLATPREQIENRADKGEHYLLEVDNPLVIPAGRRVRLLITANDVIHAWWVPAFGVKMDAIPGFIKDTWVQVDEPGTYRGQCAELCGKDHGFMPIVVEAKSPEDYDAWLVSQKGKMASASVDPNKVFALAELKSMGEKVYAANCVACHQADGKGIAGVFQPLDGSPIATGPKAIHIDRVMHGKAGTAMAAFEKQLSDVEIAAVVTYERNAWGNHTGDAIQPSDIKALRK